MSDLKIIGPAAPRKSGLLHKAKNLAAGLAFTTAAILPGQAKGDVNDLMKLHDKRIAEAQKKAAQARAELRKLAKAEGELEASKEVKKGVGELVQSYKDGKISKQKFFEGLIRRNDEANSVTPGESGDNFAVRVAGNKIARNLFVPNGSSKDTAINEEVAKANGLKVPPKPTDEAKTAAKGSEKATTTAAKATPSKDDTGRTLAAVVPAKD